MDQYTEVLANREANLKVSLGETGIAIGGVTVDMDQVDDAFVATRDACLQHRLDEVTLQDPAPAERPLADNVYMECYNQWLGRSSSGLVILQERAKACDEMVRAQLGPDLSLVEAGAGETRGAFRDNSQKGM